MRRQLVASAVVLCATVVALPAQAPAPRKTVARDPAYTAVQADRGRHVYETHCVTCHLPDLDGSANPTANAKGAPLVGPRFVQDFGETKVSALFNKMKRDMPNGKPGSLTDQEYLDVASFVLQRNTFPAGQSELTVDSAAEVWIPGAGGAEGLQDYAYVSGVGCLQQDASRSWLLTRAPELRKTDVPAAGAAPNLSPPGDTQGEFTFRLLDAYSYDPEPHNGRRVRVTGYLVRLGAEIRVNVQTLQTLGTSCGL